MDTPAHGWTRTEWTRPLKRPRDRKVALPIGSVPAGRLIGATIPFCLVRPLA